MIICTFFLAASSANVAAFNTVYSLPKTTSYLSLTLKVQSAAYPYAYPRLELCLTSACDSYLVDTEGWQYGLEYQYVWFDGITGTTVYYRVSSNSTSMNGIVMDVSLQQSSSKTCSPQCTTLGNVCENSKCICKGLYVGESCSVYINRIATGVIKQATAKANNFPLIYVFMFSKIELDSINQFTIEIDNTNTDVSVYFQESAQLLPSQLASPISYSSMNKVNNLLQVPLPKLNRTNTVLSIALVKDISPQSTQIRVYFQPKSSLMWTLLIVLLGILLLVSTAYLIYKHIYLPRSQRNLQINILEKYFPPIKFQIVGQLLKQSSKSEAECPICLTNFGAEQMVRVTYCFHIFHSNCLQLWLQKNASCPYCRKEHSLTAIQGYYSSLDLPNQVTEEQLVSKICSSQAREVINQTNQQIT